MYEKVNKAFASTRRIHLYGNLLGNGRHIIVFEWTSITNSFV